MTFCMFMGSAARVLYIILLLIFLLFIIVIYYIYYIERGFCVFLLYYGLNWRKCSYVFFFFGGGGGPEV